MAQPDLLTKEIHAILNTVKLREKRLRMVRGALYFVLSLLAISLVGGLFDRVVQPDGAGRWLVALVAYGGSLAAFYFLWLRPVGRPIDDVEAAWLLERGLTGMNEKIISAVELSTRDAQSEQVSSDMILALIASLQADTETLPVDKVSSLDAVRRPAQILGALAAVIVVMMMIPSLRFHKLAARLWLPGANISRVGPYTLDIVDPLDEIAEGEPYPILVACSSDEIDSVEVTVVFKNGYTRPLPVRRDAENAFRIEFTQTEVDFKYRAISTGADSPWYHVRVQPLPSVVEYEKIIQWPKYTEKGETHERSPEGFMKGFRGARAELIIHTDLDTDRAFIVINKGERRPLERAKKSADASTDTVTKGLGPSFSYPFTFTRPSEFVIHLESADGLANRTPDVFKIDIVTDEVPTVEIDDLEDPRNLLSKGILPLRFKATDDYGLARVTLVYSINGLARREHVILRDIPVEHRESVESTYKWDMLDLNIGEKDYVDYYIAATDITGQTGNSDIINITPRSTTFITRYDEALRDELNAVMERFKHLSNDVAALLTVDVTITDRSNDKGMRKHVADENRAFERFRANVNDLSMAIADLEVTTHGTSAAMTFRKLRIRFDQVLRQDMPRLEFLRADRHSGRIHVEKGTNGIELALHGVTKRTTNFKRTLKGGIKVDGHIITGTRPGGAPWRYDFGGKTNVRPWQTVQSANNHYLFVHYGHDANYFNDQQTYVMMLDCRTGKPKWRRRVQDLIRGWSQYSQDGSGQKLIEKYNPLQLGVSGDGTFAVMWFTQVAASRIPSVFIVLDKLGWITTKFTVQKNNPPVFFTLKPDNEMSLSGYRYILSLGQMDILLRRLTHLVAVSRMTADSEIVSKRAQNLMIRFDTLRQVAARPKLSSAQRSALRKNERAFVRDLHKHADSTARFRASRILATGATLTYGPFTVALKGIIAELDANPAMTLTDAHVDIIQKGGKQLIGYTSGWRRTRGLQGLALMPDLRIYAEHFSQLRQDIVEIEKKTRELYNGTTEEDPAAAKIWITRKKFAIMNSMQKTSEVYAREAELDRRLGSDLSYAEDDLRLLALVADSVRRDIEDSDVRAGAIEHAKNALAALAAAEYHMFWQRQFEHQAADVKTIMEQYLDTLASKSMAKGQVREALGRQAYWIEQIGKVFAESVKSGEIWFSGPGENHISGWPYLTIHIDQYASKIQASEFGSGITILKLTQFAAKSLSGTAKAIGSNDTAAQRKEMVSWAMGPKLTGKNFQTFEALNKPLLAGILASFERGANTYVRRNDHRRKRLREFLPTVSEEIAEIADDIRRVKADVHAMQSATTPRDTRNVIIDKAPGAIRDLAKAHDALKVIAHRHRVRANHELGKKNPDVATALTDVTTADAIDRFLDESLTPAISDLDDSLYDERESDDPNDEVIAGRAKQRLRSADERIDAASRDYRKLASAVDIIERNKGGLIDNKEFDRASNDIMVMAGKGQGDFDVAADALQNKQQSERLSRQLREAAKMPAGPAKTQRLAELNEQVNILRTKIQGSSPGGVLLKNRVKKAALAKMSEDLEKVTEANRIKDSKKRDAAIEEILEPYEPLEDLLVAHGRKEHHRSLPAEAQLTAMRGVVGSIPARSLKIPENYRPFADDPDNPGTSVKLPVRDLNDAADTMAKLEEKYAEYLKKREMPMQEERALRDQIRTQMENLDAASTELSEMIFDELGADLPPAQAAQMRAARAALHKEVQKSANWTRGEVSRVDGTNRLVPHVLPRGKEAYTKMAEIVKPAVDKATGEKKERLVRIQNILTKNLEMMAEDEKNWKETILLHGKKHNEVTTLKNRMVSDINAGRKDVGQAVSRLEAGAPAVRTQGVRALDNKIRVAVDQTTHSKKILPRELQEDIGNLSHRLRDLAKEAKLEEETQIAIASLDDPLMALEKMLPDDVASRAIVAAEKAEGRLPAEIAKALEPVKSAMDKIAEANAELKKKQDQAELELLKLADLEAQQQKMLADMAREYQKQVAEVARGEEPREKRQTEKALRQLAAEMAVQAAAPLTQRAAEPQLQPLTQKMQTMGQALQNQPGQRKYQASPEQAARNQAVAAAIGKQLQSDVAALQAMQNRVAAQQQAIAQLGQQQQQIAAAMNGQAEKLVSAVAATPDHVAAAVQAQPAVQAGYAVNQAQAMAGNLMPKAETIGQLTEDLGGQVLNPSVDTMAAVAAIDQALGEMETAMLPANPIDVDVETATDIGADAESVSQLAARMFKAKREAVVVIKLAEIGIGVDDTVSRQKESIRRAIRLQVDQALIRLDTTISDVRKKTAMVIDEARAAKLAKDTDEARQYWKNVDPSKDADAIFAKAEDYCKRFASVFGVIEKRKNPAADDLNAFAKQLRGMSGRIRAGHREVQVKDRTLQELDNKRTESAEELKRATGALNDIVKAEWNDQLKDHFLLGIVTTLAANTHGAAEKALADANAHQSIGLSVGRVERHASAIVERIDMYIQGLGSGDQIAVEALMATTTKDLPPTIDPEQAAKDAALDAEMTAKIQKAIDEAIDPLRQDLEALNKQAADLQKELQETMFKELDREQLARQHREELMAMARQAQQMVPEVGIGAQPQPSAQLQQDMQKIADQLSAMQKKPEQLENAEKSQALAKQLQNMGEQLRKAPGTPGAVARNHNVTPQQGARIAQQAQAMGQQLQAQSAALGKMHAAAAAARQAADGAAEQGHSMATQMSQRASEMPPRVGNIAPTVRARMSGRPRAGVAAQRVADQLMPQAESLAGLAETVMRQSAADPSAALQNLAKMGNQMRELQQKMSPDAEDAQYAGTLPMTAPGGQRFSYADRLKSVRPELQAVLHIIQNGLAEEAHLEKKEDALYDFASDAIENSAAELLKILNRAEEAAKNAVEGKAATELAAAVEAGLLVYTDTRAKASEKAARNVVTALNAFKPAVAAAKGKDAASTKELAEIQAAIAALAAKTVTAADGIRDRTAAFKAAVAKRATVATEFKTKADAVAKIIDEKWDAPLKRHPMLGAAPILMARTTEAAAMAAKLGANRASLTVPLTSAERYVDVIIIQLDEWLEIAPDETEEAPQDNVVLDVIKDLKLNPAQAEIANKDLGEILTEEQQEQLTAEYELEIKDTEIALTKVEEKAVDLAGKLDEQSDIELLQHDMQAKWDKDMKGIQEQIAAAFKPLEDATEDEELKEEIDEYMGNIDELLLNPRGLDPDELLGPMKDELKAFREDLVKDYEPTPQDQQQFKVAEEVLKRAEGALEQSVMEADEINKEVAKAKAATDETAVALAKETEKFEKEAWSLAQKEDWLLAEENMRNATRDMIRARLAEGNARRAEDAAIRDVRKAADDLDNARGRRDKKQKKAALKAAEAKAEKADEAKTVAEQNRKTAEQRLKDSAATAQDARYGGYAAASQTGAPGTSEENPQTRPDRGSEPASKSDTKRSTAKESTAANLRSAVGMMRKKAAQMTRASTEDRLRALEQLRQERKAVRQAMRAGKSSPGQQRSQRQEERIDASGIREKMNNVSDAVDDMKQAHARGQRAREAAAKEGMQQLAAAREAMNDMKPAFNDVANQMTKEAQQAEAAKMWNDAEIGDPNDVDDPLQEMAASEKKMMDMAEMLEKAPARDKEHRDEQKAMAQGLRDLGKEIGEMRAEAEEKFGEADEMTDAELEAALAAMESAEDLRNEVGEEFNSEMTESVLAKIPEYADEIAEAARNAVDKIMEGEEYDLALNLLDGRKELFKERVDMYDPVGAAEQESDREMGGIMTVDGMAQARAASSNRVRLDKMDKRVKRAGEGFDEEMADPELVGVQDERKMVRRIDGVDSGVSEEEQATAAYGHGTDFVETDVGQAEKRMRRETASPTMIFSAADGLAAEAAQFETRMMIADEMAAGLEQEQIRANSSVMGAMRDLQDQAKMTIAGMMDGPEKTMAREALKNLDDAIQRGGRDGANALALAKGLESSLDNFMEIGQVAPMKQNARKGLGEAVAAKAGMLRQMTREEAGNRDELMAEYDKVKAEQAEIARALGGEAEALSDDISDFIDTDDAVGKETHDDLALLAKQLDRDAEALANAETVEERRKAVADMRRHAADAAKLMQKQQREEETGQGQLAEAASIAERLETMDPESPDAEALRDIAVALVRENPLAGSRRAEEILDRLNPPATPKDLDLDAASAALVDISDEDMEGMPLHAENAMRKMKADAKKSQDGVLNNAAAAKEAREGNYRAAAELTKGEIKREFEKAADLQEALDADPADEVPAEFASPRTKLSDAEEETNAMMQARYPKQIAELGMQESERAILAADEIYSAADEKMRSAPGKKDLSAQLDDLQELVNDVESKRGAQGKDPFKLHEAMVRAKDALRDGDAKTLKEELEKIKEIAGQYKEGFAVDIAERENAEDQKKKAADIVKGISGLDPDSVALKPSRPVEFPGDLPVDNLTKADQDRIAELQKGFDLEDEAEKEKRLLEAKEIMDKAGETAAADSLYEQVKNRVFNSMKKEKGEKMAADKKAIEKNVAALRKALKGDPTGVTANILKTLDEIDSILAKENPKKEDVENLQALAKKLRGEVRKKTRTTPPTTPIEDDIALMAVAAAEALDNKAAENQIRKGNYTAAAKQLRKQAGLLPPGPRKELAEKAAKALEQVVENQKRELPVDLKNVVEKLEKMLPGLPEREAGPVGSAIADALGKRPDDAIGELEKAKKETKDEPRQRIYNDLEKQLRLAAQKALNDDAKIPVKDAYAIGTLWDLAKGEDILTETELKKAETAILRGDYKAAKEHLDIAAEGLAGAKKELAEALAKALEDAETTSPELEEGAEDKAITAAKMGAYERAAELAEDAGNAEAAAGFRKAARAKALAERRLRSAAKKEADTKKREAMEKAALALKNNDIKEAIKLLEDAKLGKVGEDIAQQLWKALDAADGPIKDLKEMVTKRILEDKMAVDAALAAVEEGDIKEAIAQVEKGDNQKALEDLKDAEKKIAEAKEKAEKAADEATDPEIKKKIEKAIKEMDNGGNIEVAIKDLRDAGVDDAADDLVAAEASKTEAEQELLKEKQDAAALAREALQRADDEVKSNSKRIAASRLRKMAGGKELADKVDVAADEQEKAIATAEKALDEVTNPADEKALKGSLTALQLGEFQKAIDEAKKAGKAGRATAIQAQAALDAQDDAEDAIAAAKKKMTDTEQTAVKEALKAVEKGNFLAAAKIVADNPRAAEAMDSLGKAGIKLEEVAAEARKKAAAETKPEQKKMWEDLAEAAESGNLPQAIAAASRMPQGQPMVAKLEEARAMAEEGRQQLQTAMKGPDQMAKDNLQRALAAGSRGDFDTAAKFAAAAPEGKELADKFREAAKAQGAADEYVDYKRAREMDPRKRQDLMAMQKAMLNSRIEGAAEAAALKTALAKDEKMQGLFKKTRDTANAAMAGTAQALARRTDWDMGQLVKAKKELDAMNLTRASQIAPPVPFAKKAAIEMNKADAERKMGIAEAIALAETMGADPGKQYNLEMAALAAKADNFDEAIEFSKKVGPAGDKARQHFTNARDSRDSAKLALDRAIQVQKEELADYENIAPRRDINEGRDPKRAKAPEFTFEGIRGANATRDRMTMDAFRDMKNIREAVEASGRNDTKTAAKLAARMPQTLAVSEKFEKVEMLRAKGISEAIKRAENSKNTDVRNNLRKAAEAGRRGDLMAAEEYTKAAGRQGRQALDSFRRAREMKAEAEQAMSRARQAKAAQIADIDRAFADPAAMMQTDRGRKDLKNIATQQNALDNAERGNYRGAAQEAMKQPETRRAAARFNDAAQARERGMRSLLAAKQSQPARSESRRALDDAERAARRGDLKGAADHLQRAGEPGMKAFQDFAVAQHEAHQGKRALRQAMKKKTERMAQDNARAADRSRTANNKRQDQPGSQKSSRRQQGKSSDQPEGRSQRQPAIPQEPAAQSADSGKEKKDEGGQSQSMSMSAAAAKQLESPLQAANNAIEQGGDLDEAQAKVKLAMEITDMPELSRAAKKLVRAQNRRQRGIEAALNKSLKTSNPKVQRMLKEAAKAAKDGNLKEAQKKARKAGKAGRETMKYFRQAMNIGQDAQVDIRQAEAAAKEAIANANLKEFEGKVAGKKPPKRGGRKDDDEMQVTGRNAPFTGIKSPFDSPPENDASASNDRGSERVKARVFKMKIEKATTDNPFLPAIPKGIKIPLGAAGTAGGMDKESAPDDDRKTASKVRDRKPRYNPFDDLELPEMPTRKVLPPRPLTARELADAFKEQRKSVEAAEAAYAEQKMDNPPTRKDAGQQGVLTNKSDPKAKRDEGPKTAKRRKVPAKPKRSLDEETADLISQLKEQMTGKNAEPIAMPAPTPGKWLGGEMSKPGSGGMEKAKSKSANDTAQDEQDDDNTPLFEVKAASAPLPPSADIKLGGLAGGQEDSGGSKDKSKGPSGKASGFELFQSDSSSSDAGGSGSGGPDRADRQKDLANKGKNKGKHGTGLQDGMAVLPKFDEGKDKGDDDKDKGRPNDGGPMSARPPMPTALFNPLPKMDVGKIGPKAMAERKKDAAADDAAAKSMKKAGEATDPNQVAKALDIAAQAMAQKTASKLKKAGLDAIKTDYSQAPPGESGVKASKYKPQGRKGVGATTESKKGGDDPGEHVGDAGGSTGNKNIATKGDHSSYVGEDVNVEKDWDAVGDDVKNNAKETKDVRYSQHYKGHINKYFEKLDQKRKDKAEGKEEDDDEDEREDEE